MDSLSAVLRAHALLDALTPLKTDCGRLCDGACCQGDETTGMLLFPGEDALYERCAFGRVLSAGFSLGGAPTHLQGFQITDACIGCGKCARNCPQQCITPGKPYVINQEHCLHCGLCFENCPVRAIVRRG